MSENPQSWFHCGRCNSLFMAPMGEVENRICSECGGNPVISDALAAIQEIPPAPQPTPPTAPESSSKQPSKKRKKSHLIVKLLILWFIFIGAIIVRGIRNAPSPSQETASAASREKPDVPDQAEMALINEAMPAANSALSGFISTTSPEQRSQFVANSLSVASKMASFYALNPVARIEPATLRNTANAVLHLPSAKALETNWTSTEGYKIDAVFIKESDDWKLDWNHFARVSDYPWPLFLAGSGPTTGEFRLLARERLADERKNQPDISLVFYAPRFGSPEETGPQSPEFLVNRESEDGRLLAAAFELEKEDKRPFGLKLPSDDPDEFIRVRVRVTRTESEEGRKFELEKVIACHWYSDNAPGVTPKAQSAAE